MGFAVVLIIHVAETNPFSDCGYRNVKFFSYLQLPNIMVEDVFLYLRIYGFLLTFLAGVSLVRACHGASAYDTYAAGAAIAFFKYIKTAA